MVQLVAGCALADPNYPIIPKPVDLQPREGFFEVTGQTAILADPSLRQLGDSLADLVSPAAGFRPVVEERPSNDRPRIVLKINDSLEEAGEEGYRLKVAPDGVLLEARQPAGIFYGIQTLRQLLPVENFSRKEAKGVKWQIPAVEITDRPRFAWRGMLLDSARHFMPVEFVKKYIDLMAMHKLNKLHWHLTDNDGWRIEIKKYPNLTEMGSRRDHDYILLLQENPKAEYDEARYAGGYYTQKEIREIVQYARERCVEIVPEIEMPGHAGAARVSYPWLSCFGIVGKRPDLCPGKEQVYEFLQDVLLEVMDMFPGRYIHIAGDEVKKIEWKNCPHCKARMEEEGMPDVNGLQPYFLSRMEKFVIQKGRRPIGWDEILEGTLDGKSVVMAYRDDKYAAEAASRGQDAILTPLQYCYFDFDQGDNRLKKVKLPLEKAYSYEAMPAGLTVGQQRHILGVQGCLWGEEIATPARAEYMTYPRGCALAEVGWTPLKKKNYGDFLARLGEHLKRLDYLGVNYRRPDK